MLTIRLRRTGAKKDPHYRVVVTEDSTRRDGPFLEIIGHYHPRSQPAEIVFDLERTEAWLARGARMSDTVRSLYRRARAGAPVGETAPTDTAAAAVPDAEETVGERAAASAQAAPQEQESAAAPEDEGASVESAAEADGGEQEPDEGEEPVDGDGGEPAAREEDGA